MHLCGNSVLHRQVLVAGGSLSPAIQGGGGRGDVHAAGMQEPALLPGNSDQACAAQQLTRGCGNSRAVSMQRACRSLRAVKSFSSPCPTRMVSADTIWHTRRRTSGSVVSTCSEDWEVFREQKPHSRHLWLDQGQQSSPLLLVCASAALSNKKPPLQAAAWSP